MANLSPFPDAIVLDNNGDPVPGAKVYVYESGSSTLKDSYTDATEETVASNPVLADANGRVGVWIGEGAHRIVVTDANDVGVDERDNIIAQRLGAASSYTVTINTAINSTYSNARLYVTGTVTLSLLPVSEATDGFEFWVYNEGSGVVTIDPDSSETINNTATLALNQNEWAKVSCDGDEWYAFKNAEIKNNLAATAAPTLNDDSDDGYSVGSLWIDGTASPKEAYRCLDATVGAAEWVKTTLSVDELGGLAFLDILDEDDLATNSATRPPSQQSVKAYVDSKTVIETAQSTSGASTYGYTSIDPQAKEIILLFEGVSLSGTDNMLIQLGDSGGYETTGYIAASNSTLFTAGFGVASATASNVLSGAVTISLKNGNTWVAHGVLQDTNIGGFSIVAGHKALSGVLDRIRIATSGSNTFDAGEINIQIRK